MLETVTIFASDSFCSSLTNAFCNLPCQIFQNICNRFSSCAAFHINQRNIKTCLRKYVMYNTVSHCALHLCRNIFSSVIIYVDSFFEPSNSFHGIIRCVALLYVQFITCNNLKNISFRKHFLNFKQLFMYLKRCHYN